MTIRLGLDIGSNSVGSAWMDDKSGETVMGVSIFPAGVEDSDSKRGAPKNQKRREKRSMRRSIRRRSERKLRLRQVLTDARLLPQDENALAEIMEKNPWELRRKGLDHALTPHEFGRIIVHLGQRRGALGVESDGDNDEGKVKEAIERAKEALAKANARTFGEFMAMLREERREKMANGNFYETAIRNKADSFEFHADRTLIRDEFNKLWKKQSSLSGELANLLTKELRECLDDEKGDDTWRHKGALFGQRRTYWKTGTLGRCDLEPSDRCCPKGDRHAQAFRVLETVNNIRIMEKEKSDTARPLNPEEREKVIAALSRQKTASVSTVRKSLGLNKKDVKELFELNIEKDSEREINADWFYSQIVIGIFGEDAWAAFDENKKESVNRALLKFDPKYKDDEEKLRTNAPKWWGLDEDAVEKFIKAWQSRINPDKRLKLSRRAIQNLMPYMEQGYSVSEARALFAEDADSPATPEQRARYALSSSPEVRRALVKTLGKKRANELLVYRGMSSAERRFAEKHPNTLPPPPTMANPVVRKAIYEVRRHINAYLRQFGKKPDQIVIELAREAKQSAEVRNKILSRNRSREKIRKAIIEKFNLSSLTKNQQRSAVERVLLCRQQNGVCPYTGNHFSEQQAAEGEGCESDHIIPRSRGGENGLSNLVLADRVANREKGNRTPREWFDDDKFDKMLQCIRHMKNPQKDPYFTKNDFKRKWENFAKALDDETVDQWRNSQISDTAYAATQVAEYLQSALYRDDDSGKQRIFFTNGRYTSMLRRDWQLHQDGALEDAGQSRPTGKNRADHRHHAVDAAVIALTPPKIVQQLSRAWAEQEEVKSRTGYAPEREPLPPPAPWDSIEKIRAAVIAPVFGNGKDNPGLVVSHRPVKRKIIGAFHEETLYGVADKENNVFTIRIPVSKLKPKMIRPPEKVEDESGKITFRDPNLGKGGLVRDRELRQVLRDAIEEAGYNPDTFTDKHIQELAKNNALKMPSGVPVRSVKLIRKINNPVIVEKPASPLRAYVSGNNHHVEIVEDKKTGKWIGKTIRVWDAVRRVRPPKGEPKQPLVQKDHGPDCKFIMSLAEGETLLCRRRDRRDISPTYYIVAKLDTNRIHFKPHIDARMADEQDRWDISAGDLKNLGESPDLPPYKVRINPLGQVEPLLND